MIISITRNNYNIINNCGNSNKKSIAILLSNRQFKPLDFNQEVMIYILEKLALICLCNTKLSHKIVIHSNHQVVNIVLILIRVKKVNKLSNNNNNSNKHNNKHNNKVPINQKHMFRVLLELINYWLLTIEMHNLN